MHFEDLAQVFDLRLEGRRQEISLGSYGIVEHAPSRNAHGPCTWTVLVQTGVPEQSATVLAEEARDRAMALSIGSGGTELSMAWPNGSLKLATNVPLKPGRWYRLWVAADPASGRIMVGQQGLDHSLPVTVEARIEGVVLPSSGTVLFAAEGCQTPHRHFTGKLEDPAIFPRWIDAWPDPLAESATLCPDVFGGLGLLAGDRRIYSRRYWP